MKGHNYGLCRKCGKTHIHPKGMQGKTLSAETKIRLSEIQKKIIHTKEWNHNVSLGLRGRKFTDEHRKNISIQRKNWFKTHTHPLKGKPRSEETKNKIRDTLNETYKDETIRDKYRQKRLLQIIPAKDTLIERLFQQGLEKRGIIYRKHAVLLKRYQVDLLIHKNIVIECDGDYWHNYPLGLEKDRNRDKNLSDSGFRIIRFWEREIKSDLDKCLEVVENLL